MKAMVTKRWAVLTLALVAAALLPLYRAPALGNFSGVCNDLEVTMGITTVNHTPVGPTSTSPDTEMSIPTGTPGDPEGDCTVADTTLMTASIDIAGILSGFVTCLGVNVNGTVGVTFSGGVNEYFGSIEMSMIGTLEFARAQLHGEGFLGVGTLRAQSSTVAQCAATGIPSGEEVVFDGTLVFDP